MKLSIITITLNDPFGLNKTLESLSNLTTKPHEIIVKEGLPSNILTKHIIYKFKFSLNIVHIVLQDSGIYSAMNQAKKFISGDLVHYLNSGDIVVGDPYRNLNSQCILPVVYCDSTHSYLGLSKIKLSGWGYCHQGIIFSSSHLDFNENYLIAADFDLISKTFPNGLYSLDKFNQSLGYVKYDLSGISSRKRFLRDSEMIRILFNRKKYITVSIFFITSFFKLLLPFFLLRIIRYNTHDKKIF